MMIIVLKFLLSIFYNNTRVVPLFWQAAISAETPPRSLVLVAAVARYIPIFMAVHTFYTFRKGARYAVVATPRALSSQRTSRPD